MRCAILLLALGGACGRINFDPIHPDDAIYLKASNTDANDRFGASIALSADGGTLAIGAPQEDSSAAGIDGNQTDNAAPDGGAVYLFIRTGRAWAQQAYLKATNTDAGDLFGTSVSLSADGDTLVIGAPGESSAATGIGGNETDNAAPRSGAAYVFVRTGTSWTQQAYVKASNTDASDRFGDSVALSGDSTTLTVGATAESSAALGVGGNQADNSVQRAGAAYVFTRAGTTWTQQAYVKASNTALLDSFGRGLALSTDGTTLAVGAVSQGIGSSQNTDIGATYVFVRAGTIWTEQTLLKASLIGSDKGFGGSVALSVDANTLAIGALGADRAYVFTRTGPTWTREGILQASTTEPGDQFGASVALTADGSILAVGAADEDSAAIGIGGDSADNSAPSAGAVYRFDRAASSWNQQAYVKAFNTDAGDRLGGSAELSDDGATLVMGAPEEDSAATGVGGDQTDNSAPGSGAVYVLQ